jgi:RNA polymerase sigma-70 factor (ECF subfamily)
VPSSHSRSRSPEQVEALRERFLGGDNSAFEELLGLYMPLLKFIARKYCGSPEELDDCLAESVLAFLRAMRTFVPGRGNMDAYVTTVASHRLIDMARKSARGHVELSDDLDEWSSSRGNPAEAGAYEIALAAASLSEIERACFERYLGGESLDEIARDLSVPKSSVSNALGRAKRKLSKGLGRGA